jgi:hypothetical protein
MGKKDKNMLKIDNINSTQNILETYTKSTNSDTYSLLKGTAKDTYVHSSGDEDIRYSFTNSTIPSKSVDFFNTNTANKQNNVTETSSTEEKSKFPTKKEPKNKLSTVIDESKPLTNFIGPDIENTSYYDDNNTGDLAYQMLKNISKDIQKQIEFLSDYNLSKVTNIFNTIQVRELK